jgi:hypothetical protein
VGGERKKNERDRLRDVEKEDEKTEILRGKKVMALKMSEKARARKINPTQLFQ